MLFVGSITAVLLLTTYCTIYPITTVQRWDRKEQKYIDVTCPQIVIQYNEHMVAIDKFDILAAIYRLNHKSVKWNQQIYLRILSVSAINGWLLYKRHAAQRRTSKRDTLDLFDFIARVIESLIKLDKPIFQTPRRRLRPVAFAVPNSDDSDSSETSFITTFSKRKSGPQPKISAESRFDNVDHMLFHIKPKRRCGLCSLHVRMICLKCNVYLCVTKEKIVYRFITLRAKYLMYYNWFQVEQVTTTADGSK